ncbi:MAG: hypothetical protein QM655_08770 [Nocardioidaceae bacterium]
MSTKAERRAAREKVAAYHEKQLDQLIEHVAKSVDAYRAGKQDAFDVDEIIFQYSRAAKELWKFCNLTNLEIAARIVEDEEWSDENWWERGAPKRR